MRLFSVVAMMVLVGCGGDDHEEGPICTQLSDACHDAEEAGVAGAAECHDIAHEGDEAACDAALAGCEATCAGTAGDTGAVE